MKPVTITSIYGKTLEFKDYTVCDGRGSILVKCKDDDGKAALTMVFSEAEVQALREALGVSVPGVSVSTVGELSSIEVTGGSVVINATGTVIVNNK